MACRPGEVARIRCSLSWDERKLFLHDWSNPPQYIQRTLETFVYYINFLVVWNIIFLFFHILDFNKTSQLTLRFFGVAQPPTNNFSWTLMIWPRVCFRSGSMRPSLGCPQVSTNCITSGGRGSTWTRRWTAFKELWISMLFFDFNKIYMCVYIYIYCIYPQWTAVNINCDIYI